MRDYALATVLTASALFAGQGEAVAVNPLPKPVNITWGSSGCFTVGSLTLDGTNNKIVSNAFNRMVKTATNLKWTPAAVEAPPAQFEPFPSSSSKRRRAKGQYSVDVPSAGNCTGSIKSVKVDVADAHAQLLHGVDESYKLELAAGSDTVKITAKTVYGALHAFTTMQQMIINDGSGKLIIEQPVSVDDAPLYPVRGIMIDSGRNFISKAKILEQIDGMALSKLNVLHWHMVDSQSWAVEINAYPEMTKDAYSANEVYSQATLKEIVFPLEARRPVKWSALLHAKASLRCNPHWR
ncbi:glycoside hydrolase family 20 protein [Exserohilum turcica Et28A]|uniref:beta-N-acetylhexosaminidase n=1 Tax=Exserohilum turcicum (strain 28A) TaxID=671987 RepID=R0IYJ3_EXST2|nr:glycoside hydrolase family 20 protein [Exserohilum turcica Et28A]EOA89850.1 glycoside hydrolase family 20 protein [Exserohilum turcica Et28A]